MQSLQWIPRPGVRLASDSEGVFRETRRPASRPEGPLRWRKRRKELQRMKCVCGISYSDNLDLWEELELDSVTVLAAECPDCREPGIKLSRDNRDKESAVTIYPVGPTRDPIKLVGVPEELVANYKKALRALRASLVERYGSGGRERLDTLIDKLLEDRGAAVSPGVRQNIDAVRQLGNMEAHEFDALSPEQVEWGVTIWERFMSDWYVQPLEDEAHRDALAAV